MSVRSISCVAAVLALTAGLGGCTTEPEEPDTISVPDTWTIPADVCNRLDLPSVIDASLSDPNRPAKPRSPDVEPDRAFCAAGAGSAFQLTVELRTSTDTQQHAADWDSAQARLSPPSTWSRIGPVKTEEPEPDVAAWAQKTDGATYSVVSSSTSEERDDALYVVGTVIAADDDLVAIVSATSTSPSCKDDAQQVVSETLLSAMAQIPEALNQQ